MTWLTLTSVMSATRIEFTPALAAQHCFVRLPSGKWCRVLGAPAANARWIKGRIYHLEVSP